MSTLPLAAVSSARAPHRRTTEQVLESHLASFANGIDAILADYDARSVLITPDRVFNGIDEIRSFFVAFLEGSTKAFWSAFTLEANVVRGDVAYIAWSARPAIALATDTLVIREGIIATQTFTSFATAQK